MRSIIIPSLNEGQYLQDAVCNIINTISSNDYEIIIINSGGSETSKIKDLKFVHLFNSEILMCPSQARNVGAAKASREILLFVDAHVLFDYGWDSKIFDAIKNDNMIVSPCIATMDNESIGGYGFKWNNMEMDIEWLYDSTSNIREIPFAGVPA